MVTGSLWLTLSRQLRHLPCWDSISSSAPAGFQAACHSLLQAPSADFNVRLLQLNGVAQQQQLVCRLCVRRSKLVLKAPGWMQHRAPFTRELQVQSVVQGSEPSLHYPVACLTVSAAAILTSESDLRMQMSSPLHSNCCTLQTKHHVAIV